MTANVLRLIGIAIAVVGAIDPAVTSVRTTKPEVALVVVDPARDRALGDRVATELARKYSVIRGAFSGAEAVVAVGTSLPPNAGDFRAPAFAVVSDPNTPRVAIEALTAPGRASVQSRIPIAARVRVIGARGRKVTVDLRRESLVVDRVSHDVASDDAMLPITLGFVPANVGAVPLVVTARIDGAEASARADLGVDVRDDRRAVLVFDRRPSWMSTFVRRALEADPRFVVTSRVATSRAVSAETGRPPAALDALPSLALFDVVIAGAPDELTDADVAGLEDFLRQRGGAVVLLMDQSAEGKPFERLAGVTRWSRAARAAPSALAGLSDDAGALQASEMAWPAAMPPASTAVTRPGAAPAETPVWLAPVGLGQLLVSGALDAWRFRDANAAAFDRFWRFAIGEMASASATFTVTLDRMVVAPGETTTLRVRGTGSDPFSTDFAIKGSDPFSTVFTEKGSDPLIRAPVPGAYPITVTSQGRRETATLLVVDGAKAPTPDERALVDAWAASRGGRVIPERELGELTSALARALTPPSRAETWHPLRAAWWIVPFALALGGEWWTRRRAGLR